MGQAVAGEQQLVELLLLVFLAMVQPHSRDGLHALQTIREHLGLHLSQRGSETARVAQESHGPHAHDGHDGERDGGEARRGAEQQNAAVDGRVQRPQQVGQLLRVDARGGDGVVLEQGDDLSDLVGLVVLEVLEQQRVEEVRAQAAHDRAADDPREGQVGDGVDDQRGQAQTDARQVWIGIGCKTPQSLHAVTLLDLLTANNTIKATATTTAAGGVGRTHFNCPLAYSAISQREEAIGSSNPNRAEDEGGGGGGGEEQKVFFSTASHLPSLFLLRGTAAVWAELLAVWCACQNEERVVVVQRVLVTVTLCFSHCIS
eukprot:scaffold4342_cov166-Ochromonas_danica.AAC.12